MVLNIFLGSCRNHGCKIIVTDNFDSKKVICEGSYSELSSKIFELEIDHCEVMNWDFEDNTLYVGIYKQ